LDQGNNIFSEESLMSAERSTDSARSSKEESKNPREASNMSVDTLGIEIARASFKDQARISIVNLISQACLV
jgi:hypothetical protein